MINKETFNYRYKGYEFPLKYPILDIGGKDGEFLEVVGAISGTIIDLIEGANPKYKHIQADISKKLPNLDKTFDTIFITETLEHLKNPLYLMAQVFDILNDDGNCFISVPYTKININEHSSGEWDFGHVSRWKLKEIINQMQKIGFEVEVIQARRRFKNTAFFLPHCWILLRLTKPKIVSRQ